MLNLKNLFKSKSKTEKNDQKEKRNSVSPLDATLRTAGTATTFAGIATGIISTLGLATGSIVCMGIASAIGIASLGAWYLAKREAMKKSMLMHNLTPNGKIFACGTNNDNNLILNNTKTR